jgi:hypothetical protein
MTKRVGLIAILLAGTVLIVLALLPREPEPFFPRLWPAEAPDRTIEPRAGATTAPATRGVR